MLLEIDGYHLLTLSFKKKNLTADVIYQEVISKITRFLNLAGELNSTRREQKESPSALCTLQTDADKARWYENIRSEEHTSELQSRGHLVCRLLLEKKNIA